MEVSESHFGFARRFDSTQKYTPFDHSWNSVIVDNESVYVEQYIYFAEHLN